MISMAKWVCDKGRQWLQRHSELAELERIGDADRQAMGRDLRVSGNVLVRLVERGREANELQRLMRTLNLDPERLRQSDPALANDLGVVCSLCDTSAKCRRDLKAGKADAVWKGYCPNTETLLQLYSSQNLKRTSGTAPSLAS